MTAKQQLGLIKTNKELIRQLETRQNELRNYGVRAVDYSGVKVKTSPISSVENQAIKNLELSQGIETEIIKKILENDKILDTVYKMDGGIYSQILYMRYDEGKALNQIAIELDYSYHYVCAMHTKALKMFEEYCCKSDQENKSE